ncbi:MAG TPA: hypothetical protein VEV81_00945 [Pyrinomonadaceae bacterium]|nr:hypothetical protein [Pyrinomonadaceae bacterium]
MAGKLFGVGLLLFILGTGLFAGQWEVRAQTQEGYTYAQGDLNVWTTDTVLWQKSGDAPELVAMRFGKHRGYDRVVFEMDGEFAGYHVTYEEPFLRDGEGPDPKVRGKVFAKIALYPIYSTEEKVEAYDRIAARQDRRGMPVIRGIKQLEWFEGELSYVIGLRRRTPFRVQVFSNPTRLVVDFKS